MYIMKAESEQEAVAFSKWLWSNYICYYGGSKGQWLGHSDNKVYSTENLYEKWTKATESEQSIVGQDEKVAN